MLAVVVAHSVFYSVNKTSFKRFSYSVNHVLEIVFIRLVISGILLVMAPIFFDRNIL